MNVCLKFCFSGCSDERISWRQKSVFCLIVAIFHQREICSGWQLRGIIFFNSNLFLVLAVTYLDSNVGMAVSQEVPLVILSVTFHSRLCGWGNQVRRNSLRSSWFFLLSFLPYKALSDEERLPSLGFGKASALPPVFILRSLGSSLSPTSSSVPASSTPVFWLEKLRS